MAMEDAAALGPRRRGMRYRPSLQLVDSSNAAPQSNAEDIDLRYPLQTGETSIDALDLLKIASFIGGVALVGALGSGHRELLSMAVVPYLGAVIVSLFAYWRRASDIVLTHDGARIVGGAHHGRRFPWSELDSVEVAVGGVRVNDERQVNLVVKLADGSAVQIARSYDQDEAASFSDLASVLTAAIFESRMRADAQPHAAARKSAVLECEGCGAALRPIDAETTKCTKCGRSCPVPPEIAEKVRDARESPAVERAVRRALAQPLGISMNRQTLAVGLLVVGALPIACALSFPYLNRMVLALAILGTLVGLLHLRVVGRHAVRIALSMSSVKGAGGMASCRVCGAPLPAATHHASIVRCAYCAAHNVLGRVGVRRLDPDQRSYTIDDFLSARRYALGRQGLRALVWFLGTSACLAWIITGHDFGPVRIASQGKPPLILSGGNKPPPPPAVTGSATKPTPKGK